jgi:hypothetical protein
MHRPEKYKAMKPMEEEEVVALAKKYEKSPA